ncbi:hypothetical protein [Fulvimonas yonginensis]|uniref:DUF4384 domain-containing protein n=1 Tax=Fulvimonas yonginensis TaxID=1495200 RepID=A0ABU8JE96_9GAMM
MDRWLRKLAGLPLAAATLPAFAQAPAPAGAAGPHLEFDQLSLSLPVTQAVPPPDAFEQQYLVAVRTLHDTRSPTSLQQLQALARGLPAPGTSVSLARERAGIVAAGVGEMAQGLALRNVPLLGAAADMVEQDVRRHAEQRQLAAMQARVARQNAWAQALLARPRLLHVALWDDRVRVDDLDGGQVLLILPAQGRRLLLDPASRTYRRLPAVPAPAVTACDSPARDVAALDNRSIDGVVAHGYRFRLAESQPFGDRVADDGHVRYVSDLALPAQVLQLLPDGAPCPPDSAAAASMPGHGRLVLYEAIVPSRGDASLSPEPAALAPMLERTRVLWRGHLHALTEADRDRFAVPPDYRPADPP